MSPSAQSTLKSRVGGVPNLYYGSPLKEDLRLNTYSKSLVHGVEYLSLPEAETLFCRTGTEKERVIDKACLVRQDTELWSQMHNYCLTSGQIGNFLGIWEPNAAKRLGLSKKSAGHKRLVSTCSKAVKNWVGKGANSDALIYSSGSSLESHLYQTRSNTAALLKRGGGGVDKDDELGVSRSLERYCSATANRGILGVNKAWGNVQESAGALNFMSTRNAEHDLLCEVGLCLMHASDLPPDLSGKYTEDDLPLLGASPDAMLISRSPSWSENDKAGTCRYSAAPSLFKTWLQHVASAKFRENDSGDHKDPEMLERAMEKCKISVVEIKCPASFNQVKSRRGRNKYFFRNSIPQRQVYAHQVPQIQLQMLVTGTEEAKICTYSPSKGQTIFCMKRDVLYQDQMLKIISQVHKTYVKTGEKPRENIFFKESFYQDFLEHTKRIAQETQVELQVDEPIHVPKAYGKAPFWDQE